MSTATTSIRRRAARQCGAHHADAGESEVEGSGGDAGQPQDSGRASEAAIAGQGLRDGQLELSLETAVSLRQKGYFLSPEGRMFSRRRATCRWRRRTAWSIRCASATWRGPSGDNRNLFVTAGFDQARAASLRGRCSGRRAPGEGSERAICRLVLHHQRQRFSAAHPKAGIDARTSCGAAARHRGPAAGRARGCFTAAGCRAAAQRREPPRKGTGPPP